ncbi:MAG: hypothetical protein ABSG73_01325 [Candidatus Aminicenantales bacterium]|jgi:hypothetical protein
MKRKDLFKSPDPKADYKKLINAAKADLEEAMERAVELDNLADLARALGKAEWSKK